jgi:two-component system nitrate/nitrite response regulator NarL
MSKACLILVGENRLFREGLGHVLVSEDITIAAQVSYLSEVPALLRSAGPSANLIVYDQSEDFIRDCNALKAIAQEFTGISIVILADHVDQAGLDLAVAGGACGFLPKSISAAALRLSIGLVLLCENIFAGHALVARGRPVAANPLNAAETHPLRSPLSPREREILNCLELGLPNKTIARNLDMAEATVKVQLKSVLRKIKATNRTQAAVWAMNNRQNLAQLV